jgi:small GTP-binding protein
MSTSSCSLAIVGDGSVGKSTLIQAFRTEGFMPVYKQTIGVDFYEKNLQIKGETNISLKVWDVGGQSIHSKNLSSYLTSASVVLLVYDVTNPESFENLIDWLSQVKKNTSTNFIYVAGNKVDLIAARQISNKKQEDFIFDNNLSGGIYVSAKTGENVVKMFYKIASEVIGERLTEQELTCFDKVLKATVVNSDSNEIRNAWADEIEKEDLQNEKNKQLKEGCNCCCS